VGFEGVAESKERAWIEEERRRLHEDAVAAAKPALLPNKLEDASSHDNDTWMLYITAMTSFVAASLIAVMAACTALRTHLFIWTVFSPKYLYVMAWAAGWHLGINVGLGSLLWWLGRVR
jgi:ethanolaminephosphotransferase